jgi:hypothetical protein
MEGPEAAVWASAVIGAAVTLTTAIIKLVPRRLLNGAGERYVTAIEFAEYKPRIAQLEREQVRESKYIHEAIEDIREYLHALEMDLTRACFAREVHKQLLHEQQERRRGG